MECVCFFKESFIFKEEDPKFGRACLYLYMYIHAHTQLITMCYSLGVVCRLGVEDEGTGIVVQKQSVGAVTFALTSSHSAPPVRLGATVVMQISEYLRCAKQFLKQNRTEQNQKITLWNS